MEELSHHYDLLFDVRTKEELLQKHHELETELRLLRRLAFEDGIELTYEADAVEASPDD